MKGIILAGGTGSRLYPLTKVTNKALLPIYNKPMIYWAIETLIKSGIDDILLVCGGNCSGDFLTILGNGEEFGLKNLHYTYQKEPKGIADALSLAETWAKKEPVAVMLSDNIFENNFFSSILEFEKNPHGAKIFVYEVENPSSYGVVEFKYDLNHKKNIAISIEEKPKVPKSNFIATGFYIYDSEVWSLIKSLTLSQRNELEITDLNNLYLKKGLLSVEKVSGWWSDAGENIEVYNDCCYKAREIFN